MKRTLLSFAAVTSMLAASFVLSGCATTSETTAKTNPAEMLASQQTARWTMEQQSRSVEKAGRAPNSSSSGRK